MQPMNSYYQYTPSNMNPYGQPMADQRQMRYMPMNQPQQPVNVQYQNNPYGQRMSIQNQWHGQTPISPNKMTLPNTMPDYGARPNTYGYNPTMPSNFPQIALNYPQQTKYPPVNQPIIMGQNTQQYPPQHGQQYHQQNTYIHQTQYQQQQQQQMQLHQQQAQQQFLQQ